MISFLLPRKRGTDQNLIPNRNMESTNNIDNIHTGVVVKLLPTEEQIFSTIVQLLDLVSPDKKIAARYVDNTNKQHDSRFFFVGIESLIIIFISGSLVDGLETR